VPGRRPDRVLVDGGLARRQRRLQRDGARFAPHVDRAFERGRAAPPAIR